MNDKKPAKKKKKNTKRKMLSVMRKDASVFLTSEEGKIIKKDIVKMALAMGMTAASLGTAQAQTHTDNTPVSHTDTPGAHTDYAQSELTNSGNAGYHNSAHTDNYSPTVGHTDNVTAGPHTDTITHSSHGSGGWC